MGSKTRCISCNTACNGERCRLCRNAYVKETAKFDKTEWRRSRLYGMEPGEFDIYWMAQRGMCYVCNIQMKPPSKGKGQALDVVAVDHCHKTGKFRGLLCNGCNKALGFFKDDLAILRSAINYLEQGSMK